MARQLFGTDGIRGVAGEAPLDPPTVSAFGAALGRWATQHSDHPDVVIGMDTRESGRWLAECVAGGLAAAGAKAHFAGVITTPGVAHLTRTGDFVAGVMISASHNPYHDNGLKVFDHSGYKLPDDEEHALEQVIFEERGRDRVAAPDALGVEQSLDAQYLDHLAALGPSLTGLKMVVDCGHGAASDLAPALFRRLGAEVVAICHAPDGRNINQGCGALHPEVAGREVTAAGADLGVAFDGDADRAIFAAPSGKTVNGDGVLLLCGKALHAKGRLGGNDGQPLVVSTVMANLGLEKALAAHGIRMLRTPVGDKYVLEEMRRRNATLGGEQSGHVIYTNYATTGDGLLTALRVLEVIRESGQNLDELTAELKVFPQELLNIRVREKRPVDEVTAVREAILEAEEAFGDSGRIVVRYSGTERLARVMIEGEDAALVGLHCRRIASAFQQELGLDG